MPSKKPPAIPAPPNKTTTQPAARKGPAAASNARQQPANRWQRSKRFGWDSR